MTGWREGGVTLEGRLLLSGPGSAARNMAVDEAVAVHVGRGAAPPTLRFYGWQPRAVSLGFFQPWRHLDADACRRLGLDWVRRPSGGRAVLHAREVTYSLALPAGALPGGVSAVYQQVSRGLLAGLKALGAPADLVPAARPAPGAPRGGGVLCFASHARHEVAVDGRKILGSAQWRSGGAILQHGSLPLELDADLLERLVRPADRAGRAHWRGPVAGPLPACGLFEALGREVPVPDVEAALARGLAETLGVIFREDPLLAEEEKLARRLAREKYASEAWLKRR